MGSPDGEAVSGHEHDSMRAGPVGHVGDPEVGVVGMSPTQGEGPRKGEACEAPFHADTCTTSVPCSAAWLVACWVASAGFIHTVPNMHAWQLATATGDPW